MQLLRRSLVSALLALTIPYGMHAQTASPSQAPRSPIAEQSAERQRIDAFLVERTRLSTAAKQALAAEAVRERNGDCPNAGSTFAELTCLEKEGKTTGANYDTLTQSIRAMLALRNPYDDGPPTSGPTGTPLTTSEQLAEFDKLQSDWNQYRQTALSAAYDQFKGGTEAPISAGEASQALLRSHMRELAYIYDFLLGNH